MSTPQCHNDENSRKIVQVGLIFLATSVEAHRRSPKQLFASGEQRPTSALMNRSEWVSAGPALRASARFT
jgi:hypothetical protein